MTDPQHLHLNPGAKPSPPDERDWKAEEWIGAPPEFLPPRYVAPGPYPMALDQNGFPSCTLVAVTGLKLWQDYEDNGNRWPTYDWESDWRNACANYGASPLYGWTVRDALEYARKVGLKPKATPFIKYLRAWRNGVGGYVRRWFSQPARPPAFSGLRQKIAAYVRVDTTAEAMKYALMELGPLVVASAWDLNWNNTEPNGRLKPPIKSAASGHAWIIYGWTTDANGALIWYGWNSYGEMYGIKGRFLFPDQYRSSHLWEAWKAFDLT